MFLSQSLHMKLREACVNHMQKHKERFSNVSITARVCDVMQNGLMVMMNIGKIVFQAQPKMILVEFVLFQDPLSKASLRKILL